MSRDFSSIVTSRQYFGAVVCSIALMACEVSESRCGTSGRACLRALSRTWEAVSVGPLVPETWSHRGWGFMSLVEEVNPLAPKVIGVPFEFFVERVDDDVFVEPFFVLYV